MTPVATELLKALWSGIVESLQSKRTRSRARDICFVLKFIACRRRDRVATYFVWAVAVSESLGVVGNWLEANVRVVNDGSGNRLRICPSIPEWWNKSSRTDGNASPDGYDIGASIARGRARGPIDDGPSIVIEIFFNQRARIRRDLRVSVCHPFRHRTTDVIARRHRYSAKYGPPESRVRTARHVIIVVDKILHNRIGRWEDGLWCRGRPRRQNPPGIRIANTP